ncbi:MAG: HAMP domain-containing protein [Deltaproteobacteria bacterium]|nr:HAMP domain-containing protein [Deltaproteobacteria bacterium]
MRKARLLFISNAMFFGNFVANLAGWGAVELVTSAALPQGARDAVPALRMMGMVFPFFAFLFGALGTFWYELPYRRYLKAMYEQREVPSEEQLAARRRLLNEPYFAVVLDFAIWCVAALVFSTSAWTHPAARHMVYGIAFRSIVTALITVTFAFFLIEHILQHRVTPLFFPAGDLHSTPGVLRIRIGTRLAALIFACSIVPLSAIHLTIHFSHRMAVSGRIAPEEILQASQSIIWIETLVFLLFSVALAFFLTINITRPLSEITKALEEVKQGVFDRKVRVTSNDEIGYTADMINRMTEGLRERDFIKETFGKYVTREIRDEILEGRIPLDGELREATVLFSDIRGFTGFVEATPPREVVRIINGYFGEMAEAIRQHGGLILQFIGDEIEAVFGAPIARQDHQQLAVKAALEMRRRLTLFNSELNQRGHRGINHGIGVHTGRVLAANIGSPERLSYALVGDTVNVASRIQGLNKQFDTDILVSAATRAGLNEEFDLKKLPSTMVRGKTEPLEIFRLF